MLLDTENLNADLPGWLAQALALPRSSNWVSVQGCNIHYFTWGNPKHPGLLFIHGRMSHARCWAFITPYLAQNYYCVAMDFSGMGDSAYRDEYLYAHRIAEVIAVAQESGLHDHTTQPMIVSHSYGAVVGCKAIAAHPRLFGGLIACDPSLSHPDEWPTLAPRTDGPNLTRPHRVFTDLATALSKFRFAPAQVSLHPVLEQYIALHSLKQCSDGWCWKFDPLVYSPMEQGHNNWWVTHTEEFVQLQAPKAIVFGAKSDFVDRISVTAITRHCQTHVPVQEIPWAAHHIMVDQPIALVVAIEQMAQRLASVRE